jgi:hypothetical protein
MILNSQIKFPLGQIIIAPAALTRLSVDEILGALNRHVAGDWGDLGKDDRQENQISLETGHRLLSVYHSRTGTIFWVITEADRSVTNIFLPETHPDRDVGETVRARVTDLKRKLNNSVLNNSLRKPVNVQPGLTFRFRAQ